MDILALISTINHADLTPKQKVYAFALVELAPIGPARLAWDAVEVATGLGNRGAIRNTLSALKRAGVLDYSTGDQIWIDFRCTSSSLAVKGFTDFRPQSAEVEGANHRQRCTSSSLAVKGFTDSDTPWLVGIDPITTSGKDLNQPTNQNRCEVDEDERRRNVLLLLDPEIGLSKRHAERLAESHRFGWLLRQVFAWRADMDAGKVSSPGALVSRLDNGFGPGDLTDRDRATDLYRRHVSEDEDRARVAAVYVPDEYAAIINT